MQLIGLARVLAGSVCTSITPITGSTDSIALSMRETVAVLRCSDDDECGEAGDAADQRAGRERVAAVLDQLRAAAQGLPQLQVLGPHAGAGVHPERHLGVGYLRVRGLLLQGAAGSS